MKSTPETAQELFQELTHLITEAEKMLAASVSDSTSEAVTSLRARFLAAQQRLGAFYQGTREKVSEGLHYTDATIRAKPYQSLAVAAAVGLLLGVVCSRSCNSKS